MSTESVDPRLEGVRAVLWAMASLLDRGQQLSLASTFEMRTLARTGLQLMDEYGESCECS